MIMVSMLLSETFAAPAGPTLASMFVGGEAVLQMNTTVAVWGKGAAGSEVSVSQCRSGFLFCVSRSVQL